MSKPQTRSDAKTAATQVQISGDEANARQLATDEKQVDNIATKLDTEEGKQPMVNQVERDAKIAEELIAIEKQAPPPLPDDIALKELIEHLFPTKTAEKRAKWISELTDGEYENLGELKKDTEWFQLDLPSRIMGELKKVSGQVPQVGKSGNTAVLTSLIENGLPGLGKVRWSSLKNYNSSVPNNEKAVCHSDTFTTSSHDTATRDYGSLASRFLPQYQQSKNYTLRGVNNEFPIRDTVRNIILDVAAGLGYTEGDVEILQEVQVNGVRPDLIVVFRIGRTVGAVEIKQPGFTSLSSEQKGKIYGEVFDQLMHLKTVYRASTPLVILTTYKTWQVCWLEDDASDVLATSPSDLPATSNSEEGKQLSDLKSVPFTPSKVVKASKKQTSPPPNIEKSPSKALRPARNANNKTEYSETVDEVTRVVKVSQVVQWDGKGADSVIHLLIAYLVKLSKVQLTTPIYKSAIDAYVCCMDAKTIQWKKIKSSVGLSFHQRIGSSVTNFRLWEDIGEGSVGRVFLVSGGEEHCVGAIKMLKVRSQPVASDRKNALQTEETMWNKIYGDEYSSFVRLVTLAGEPGLLMPWFASPRESERLGLLESVRQCLLDKFHTHRFKHNDVAWRNIALDTLNNDKVVLIDLESVMSLESGDSDQWVVNAMAKLKDSALSVSSVDEV